MLSDQSPINSISTSNDSMYTRPPAFETVDILGIDVAKLTVEQLHHWLGHYIQTHQKELILNVNVHCMNLCFQHNWLPGLLQQAPIVFCDGAGVMLSAKLLGDRIPERITYADWMWQLGAFAQARGFSMYFLGGKPGVAQRAAERMQGRFPQLQIVGTHHGYLPVEASATENQELIATINTLQPHILIIGMGMPRQERWLLENWRYVNANIALTGGAVFDYISGDLTRAPQWMTNHGLEWMGRLLIEPRRLWKRYVIGNPTYFMRVLRYTLLTPKARRATKRNATHSQPLTLKNPS